MCGVGGGCKPFDTFLSSASHTPHTSLCNDIAIERVLTRRGSNSRDHDKPRGLPTRTLTKVCSRGNVIALWRMRVGATMCGLCDARPCAHGSSVPSWGLELFARGVPALAAQTCGPGDIGASFAARRISSGEKQPVTRISRVCTGVLSSAA